MATTTARVTTTPRPSISPLSTTSKHPKSSPIASRDRAMPKAGIGEAPDLDNALDPTSAEVGEQADDRSSSLSEPEDDNGDAEEQIGIDDDMVDGDGVVAHRSLEVDSEAETERLDQTPPKLRKHANSLGRTPSKLSRTAATVDEDLSDPPSPLPTGAGAASSTGTVTTAGQKRKRSDTAESSLTSADSEQGGSPRKRSHDSSRNMTLGGDEVIEDIDKTADLADRIEDTPMLDESRETSTVPVKGARGRKGKPPVQRGKKQKDQVDESNAEQTEENAGAAEEASEENVVKTEAELKFKKEASTLYDDVTKQFRTFKDKLYDERLASITAELQMLSQPNCQHPEYLRQVACVDARQQKQVNEAHAYYNYKLRSIRERTLGERSQLHSQYFQTVRELREEVLYELGDDWYAIQKERRQIHRETDDGYLYKFQPKKSIQIKQQAKYNQEVSVLSGVAKYVGFPAAPDMNGADGGELDEDMKAMRISKRVHQTSSAPAPVSRPMYLPNPANSANFEQSERLAHERFIEQNAWARPQAPIIHGNHGSTPGISHTPDWAEPTTSGAKHLIRNFSSGGGIQPRNSSPFATPVPPKRTQLERSSSGTVIANSDGADIDIPSSVVAAPPTSERLGSILKQNQSSGHTSPLNIQKTRQNGTSAAGPERELTGFRNISNISGASTIDAPLPETTSSAEKMKTVDAYNSTEASTAPLSMHQVFDASQIRRPDSEKRDVFPNTGFRAAEGAFGTPAPLQQQPAPPPSVRSGAAQ